MVWDRCSYLALEMDILMVTIVVQTVTLTLCTRSLLPLLIITAKRQCTVVGSLQKKFCQDLETFG